MRPTKIFTKANVIKIKALADNGFGALQIADTIGSTPGSVCVMCSKMKIKLGRTKGSAVGASKQNFVLQSQVFIDPTEYLPVRVSGHIAAQGSLLSMRDERRNKCPPRPPLCPSCAQLMRLARITSRFDNLPDLNTFECRACGVSHIEAAAPFATPKCHASVDYEVRARTK
jgi:hypothetical protein